MRSTLVVLGGCGAWPEPGRACSGFLLEHEGFRVVLDLGYGTLPRLLAQLGSVSAEGLDAAVVTHDHPDHLVDLHGLFRARWFAARGVRLSAMGLVVAYTGDTGRDPALTQLGRDADVYIVDATDRDQQTGAAKRTVERAFDLTAREAGGAARAAGAKRLMLTDFWPGNDRELPASRPPRSFPARCSSLTRARPSISLDQGHWSVRQPIPIRTRTYTWKSGR